MKDFETDPKDRKRAVRTSVLVNIGLLILLLFPFMSFQVPPPGQEGILVSFVMPDMGSGNDMPDTQQEEDVPPEPAQEEELPPMPEPPPVVEEVVPEEEILTQEDPNAIAIREKEEREAREKAERERQEKLEEQRRQEEEARKEAEFAERKKQFGDLFGSGKGQTDTEGNQGDALGDPNADNLEGLSTGQGNVGGGLGGRRVLSAPTVEESSQKTGRVVIRVCVNNAGNVIESTYTQKGSTTGDPDLIATAIKYAKRYRFSEGTIDKQCGTITFDFKVR